jgi:hypothetical protein
MTSEHGLCDPAHAPNQRARRVRGSDVVAVSVTEVFVSKAKEQRLPAQRSRTPDGIVATAPPTPVTRTERDTVERVAAPAPPIKIAIRMTIAPPTAKSLR